MISVKCGVTHRIIFQRRVPKQTRKLLGNQINLLRAGEQALNYKFISSKLLNIKVPNFAAFAICTGNFVKDENQTVKISTELKLLKVT